MSASLTRACKRAYVIHQAVRKLMEVSEPSDPAAFINFESHDHAVVALDSIGYFDAHQKPPFSSEEILDEVNNVLKDRGITVMDMTPTIPQTPHAAYKALLIAGFQAAASCRKDENAAFLILRTAENTPSFLFGHHWQATQALGKEVASKQVRSSQTPAVIVIFRDRQICLPTSVFKTNVSIVSKIIAHEVTMDESFFSCSMCSKSFVSKGEGSCLKIAEMCVSEDGRMFRRECIEKGLSRNASSLACENEGGAMV